MDFLVENEKLRIVMIGASGSGKTYFREHLVVDFKQQLGINPLVLSSDDIRAEVFKMAVYDKDLDPTVWGYIHDQIASNPDADVVIVDGTNISPVYRSDLTARLRSAAGTEFKVVGIWLDTSVEVCKERQFNPDRKLNLPPEVIEDMARQLKENPPSLNDGFDVLLRVIDNKYTEMIV